MIRQAKRLLALITLMALAVLASGCLGTKTALRTPATGKGRLVLTFRIAGEDNGRPMKAQALRAPITKYILYLKRFNDVKQLEFPADGSAVSTELAAGFWTIWVEAVDERNIIPYASPQQTIEVQPDVTSTVDVALLPRPAKIIVTADTTALFEAGYVPSVVDVVTGNGNSTSVAVSATSPVGTGQLNVTPMRTFDLEFTARSSDGSIIARKALTDFQAYPGETVEVTWVASSPQQGSGTITIASTIYAPLEPPTDLVASWNSTTNRLDIAWKPSPDMPASSGRGWSAYMIDVQTAPNTVYRQSYWQTASTNISTDIPSEWRGKTIKLRVWAYWSDGNGHTRSSVATAPVTVTIPQ